MNYETEKLLAGHPWLTVEDPLHPEYVMPSPATGDSLSVVVGAAIFVGLILVVAGALGVLVGVASFPTYLFRRVRGTL